MAKNIARDIIELLFALIFIYIMIDVTKTLQTALPDSINLVGILWFIFFAVVALIVIYILRLFRS